MGANQDVFDAFIRHQLYLKRVSAYEASLFITELNKTVPDLRGVLLVAIDRIQSKGVLTKGRKAEYDRLRREIEKVRGPGFKTASEQYATFLQEFITSEVEFTQSVIEEALPISLSYAAVNIPVIASAIMANGQFNGFTLSQYFSELEQNDASRIVKAVKQGINLGTPTEQIVRQISGTVSQKYKDGILNKTTQGTRSMVRTTLNGVGSASRAAWSYANRSIANFDLYSAVLDGRTTPICAPLDGTLFPVGEGPFPPLHLNCRSVRIPQVDLLAGERLGNRPYVRDTRTRRLRQIDFRKDAKLAVGETRWKGMSIQERNSAIKTQKQIWQDENIGTVDARISYTEWFAKQPAAFQRDYLGPTKYNLYRTGTPLTEFVGLDGNFITLDKLKEKSIL